MPAIRSSSRASHAAMDAVPTNRHAVAKNPARAPINRLSAALNMTTAAPFRRPGGESIEAGPRDRNAIHQRMVVADSARTQLWQWIHPGIGTPFAGRAVHIDPVPDALHVEPVGKAYVRGRGSAVCVRVDELVPARITTSRDRADFPTTKTDRIL